MSAPFIIPFDNNPVSVSVVTSSYTIPSGKFARVLAECDSGGNVTVNGSNIITTSAIVSVSVQNVSNVGVSYTVPSNYEFEGQTAGAGTEVLVVGSVPLGSSYYLGLRGGPGQSFTIAAGGFGGRSITGTAKPSNATNRQGDFYLPEGSVLSGSGSWRALVQIYNKIS